VLSGKTRWIVWKIAERNSEENKLEPLDKKDENYSATHFKDTTKGMARTL